MKKKFILTTAILTMLLCVTSCSKNEVKKYSNEVTFDEFITFKDDYLELAKNNDFTLTTNMKNTGFIESSFNNTFVKQEDCLEIENLIYKVDYDSRVIEKSGNYSKDLEIKDKNSTKNQNTEDKYDIFCQKYNNDYYQYDNINKKAKWIQNFDFQLQNLLLLNLDKYLNDYDKYYVDNNVYTAYSNEPVTGETNIFQCVVKDNKYEIIKTYEIDYIKPIDKGVIQHIIEKETKTYVYDFSELQLQPRKNLDEFIIS